MPHLSLSVPEKEAMKKCVPFMSGADAPTSSSSMCEHRSHPTCRDKIDGLLSLASSAYVHHTDKTYKGHVVASKS